jgi:hypothetical protein
MFSTLRIIVDHRSHVKSGSEKMTKRRAVGLSQGLGAIQKNLSDNNLRTE